MWYKNIRFKHWMMYKDYEEDFQYGIDENKNWYIGDLTDLNNCEYLASDGEIEKGLRKEAKRRGFVKGTKFLGCEGHQKDEELIIDDIRFMNSYGSCGLYNEDSWIFRNGEWGTVVNQAWDAYLEETGRELEECFYPIKKEEVFYYHNSEKHGANFYELVKEVETKVNDSWKTFVIYKQLGSGLEFSREKEEFLSKFKQVYV